MILLYIQQKQKAMHYYYNLQPLPKKIFVSNAIFLPDNIFNSQTNTYFSAQLPHLNRLRNKKTGVTSRNKNWCYGNIFEQIEMYKKDLSKMCYVGVSNETHEIIEVIHNFNNKTIYKI